MDLLITLLMLGGWLPLAFFWAGCPCCSGVPCANCDPGTITAQIQVTLSGIVDAGVCTGCTQANGVWITTVNVAPTGTCGSPANQCRWYAHDSSLTIQKTGSGCASLCGSYVQVEAENPGVGTYRFSV